MSYHTAEGWRDRCSGWIRKHATELRSLATKAEKAYSKGPAHDRCQEVAKAYREAARVLLQHADAMRDGADGKEATP